MNPCTNHCQSLANLACAALLEELSLYPKPGLVSPVDSGSHRDMDHELLRVSAESLRPAFLEIAEAGATDAGFHSELVPLGIRAEQSMLQATGGVNTHRGAIFVLGLLIAAAANGTSDIRATLVSRWERELRQHISRGRGGAREEAANGFPSIFHLALPHFEVQLQRGLPREAAAIETLFLLIAHVDDTNVLHRGSTNGATFAKIRARNFLDAGGVSAPGWQSRAISIHAEFIERNLSPGGSADLLAGTIFVHDARHLPQETRA